MTDFEKRVTIWDHFTVIDNGETEYSLPEKNFKQTPQPTCADT